MMVYRAIALLLSFIFPQKYMSLVYFLPYYPKDKRHSLFFSEF